MPSGDTLTTLCTLWAQAVAALQANATQVGIKELLYLGNGLEERYGSPLVDIRVPDIIIVAEPGVHTLPAPCQTHLQEPV